MKRTSESPGKCNAPDSLRRSGKGKKELSSPSVSEEFTEDASTKSKKKKVKTVIQVTMESKKAVLDPEVVGMKRTNLSSRKFRALFKKQRIAPDGGVELERSEKLVGVCSDNGSSINSQRAEDTEDVGDNCSKRVVGKLRDKSVSNVSEGALPDSALRDYRADVENDINVDSCIRDYDVDDLEDKVPKSSREDSTSGNCSKRSKYYKVAEDTASTSLVCGFCDLEGTCLLCSKTKRVRYDFVVEELCSCCPMGEDLVGAADSSTNDIDILCGVCNKDGDLLICEGKNCRNCYHLPCLDPPLTDALPGSWHCPECVKKKLLLGVHSVSTGIESIWDVREVVVPNAKGVKQKQFLVKYHGLAHVYNHWVPETQLRLENPSLVLNFLKKDQDARWNAKWTVPHRLLWKRPIQDNHNLIYVASTNVIWACEYQWLVKWRDLDYDHATWELDNAKFLSSSIGQNLVRNYEVRRGKAKPEANKPHMEHIIGHSEIPRGSHETHVLDNVNKVCKFLLKCPNAVVIDDQEQTTTAIHLIHSMIETFRSFLIVATDDSLSRWEANFERLAPSVDVVVYSGSVDTRNMIRASEFYDEDRCIVQVLLSSVEAVLEDLEILKKIKWKAIVIDEYHYSGIPEGLEQIKMLSTDMRVLMVSSQIKDATSEYLKILSFVEPQGDFDKLRGLTSETNDKLSKLKERLSPFIVHVEGQILTQHKAALNDETGANDIDEDDEMKIVQKKCDKTMQKLQQKQQKEIEEVERIWKDKMDKLEIDHKLDVDLNKKIKDLDILKGAELKNLQAEHVAAINKERQRATDWLTKTKSRSLELRVINGHQSLGTLPADDAGSPQPSTCIVVDGDGDKLPIPENLENENPSISFSQQGNDVISSISSESAPADARSGETPAEKLVSSFSGNKVGAEAELIQSENFIDNGLAVLTNLPATTEQVSDENQSVKSTEEHSLVHETVPNEIVGHDSCEMLPQDTDALHEENQTAPQIEIAMSEAEDSVTPVPPNFESLVTDDIVTPETSHKAPVELQDTDALPEENRSAPQVEIAMSEPTNSVTPVPPNFESRVTDDIVRTEASDKAPVDEVFGQLHSLAVDISLSCDQLPATEHRDPERSTPQTAEPEETEVVSYQSISQADENLELHAYRASVVASTSNLPNQGVMENDVAVPQAIASTSGHPNQAVMENDVVVPMVSISEQPNQDFPPVLDIDAGNLHGLDFFLNPTRQPIWSSAPPSLTDPLQSEIVRVQKETELLEKSHADTMAQLKADCEKEIEKIIAQVRNKYEVKSGETDAEFRVKINELDKNQNKVCLNKVLANAFRSKCLDVRPFGSPSFQQGTSTSMLPPSVRPSPRPSASQPAPSIVAGISTSMLPPSVRPSPGPSASQPAPARAQSTTSPAVQQPSWSHFMRSSPSTVRNMTAHHIQGLQRAAAHLSGNSARPPVISAITPADLRASSGIRSLLPHLQSSRPVVGASMSAPPSSSASQFHPSQMLPDPPSQPAPLPRPPLVAQNSPEVRSVLGAPPGFSDHRPYSSENRNASVPDIPSAFCPLEQSDLEMLGNASVRPAVQVEASIVCLSDDE